MQCARDRQITASRTLGTGTTPLAPRSGGVVPITRGVQMGHEFYADPPLHFSVGVVYIVRCKGCDYQVPFAQDTAESAIEAAGVQNAIYDCPKTR